MALTIGCLHAHHSNIGPMECALAALGAQSVHYVDPGLIRRMAAAEPDFGLSQAQLRAAEQLEWIAKAGADAIVVTCTQYAALSAKEDGASRVGVPVVMIDEPFFRQVCKRPEPQIVLFTNPATVEGTMRRLRACARQNGASVSVEAQVLDGTFELIMRGEQAAYTDKVAQAIRERLRQEPEKGVAVAQLSMAEAAERVERETGRGIANPLCALSDSIADILGNKE